MKIGIFDSGIGGLTLARPFLAHNTVEVIYIADTAYVPYGSRSKQEIEQLSLRCVDFLYEQQVDTIIIACHTATTLAGPFIKKRYPALPIITMESTIIPQTLASTKNKHIALLATPGTIQSSIYQQMLYVLDNDIVVLSQACTTLAQSIETHLNDTTILEKSAQKYLKEIDTQVIDTLILGCTHYSIIKGIIRSHLPHCTIISSDETIFEQIDLSSTGPKKQQRHQFFVSGEQEKFRQKLSFLLNYWNLNSLNYSVYKTPWKMASDRSMLQGEALL